MNCKKYNHNIIFIFGIFILGILASPAFLLHFNQNFLYSVLAISNSTITDNTQNIQKDTNINTNNSIIPTAKSVFDTGIMSLPISVSGYIIDIPDEAHHPLSDNKTMSLKNAHYIPSNLVIPSGTAIAFVHGDPNHIHSEIVKDASSRNVVWQTIPIRHPGGSDTKILGPGSYTISDQKYSPPMGGNITVQGNERSKANDLVVGGLFVPTSSLSKYKSDFASAGFQILSEYNFLSKVVQKDIAGPTTLLIYSTTMPIQNAIANLKPIIASLPYRWLYHKFQFKSVSIGDPVVTHYYYLEPLERMRSCLWKDSNTDPRQEIITEMLWKWTDLAMVSQTFK